MGYASGAPLMRPVTGDVGAQPCGIVLQGGRWRLSWLTGNGARCGRACLSSCVTACMIICGALQVIVMDTEGFGAKDASQDSDAKLFSLATLLCSLLIYNR